MSLAVIDTNILLIANNQHAAASPECVEACIQCLLTIQNGGTIVIDEGYRILSEYQNKTRLNPPKGVGDVFLKWLLRNTGKANLVQQVAITETTMDSFAEFPDATLQPDFDPPDRKFAAVAHAHPDKPSIWQGGDCKWLNWWEALQAYGVRVEFLCPDDVCRFYARKFPGATIPSLP